MGKHWKQSTILGFFASLLVFVWCLFILDYAVKFILAPVIALLTFSLFKYLTSENDKQPIAYIRFIFVRSKNVSDFLFIVFYAFSLLLIILVPNMTNPYYVEWFEIPFFNWLRLFVAILLSTFFPGYVVFRFVNRAGKFGKLEVIIFSFFISIFLITFTSFILVSVIQLDVFTPQMMLLPNLLLLPLFAINTCRRIMTTNYLVRTHKKTVENKISLYKMTALLCFFSFIIIASYAVTLGNPYQVGDQFTWISRSLQFSKGSFPVINNRVIPFYPYWLELFLVSFFSISGVPILNAYGSLSFLTVLPSITFYLMLGSIFKQKRKVQLVGTVLTAFLGFGWIHFLYQKFTLNPSNLGEIFNLISISGNKTFDLWRGILLLPIEGIRPVYIIGYPTLFTLIYLLVRGRENRSVTWSESFLIIVLVAVGFLGHSFEVLLFFALFFLIVLFDHNFLSQSKKISFAMLLSLLIVGMIDYISPGKFYTVLKSSEGLVLSPYFFLSLFGVIIIGIMQFVKQKEYSFPSIKNHLTNDQIKLIAKTMFAIAIYIYVLSVLIWFFILDIYRPQSVTLPWYMYWIRLGVVGILGLIGIRGLVIKKHENLKALSFFVFTSLVFFIVLILGRTPYFITFDESRLMFLLYIALIIPAAYAIVHYLQKFNNHNSKYKSLLVFSFLILIILGGISSTLLKFEFFSLIEVKYGAGTENPYAYLSSDDFNALNYLRTNLPSNASVATASIISRAKLEGLSGMSDMQARSYLGFGGDNAETWDILFSSESPETVSYLLNSLKVKYIYVAQQDLLKIDQKYEQGYIAQHLLNYLPIAFNNSEVTIYEVPPLLTTFPSSNLALVLQEQTKISSVVDQEQTSYTKSSFVHSNVTYAQRFKPNDKGISRISIFASKAGIPNAGITIEIQGDENGVPDGVTFAKGLIEETDVKTSGSEVIANVSCQSLNTSKYYHIVVYSNGTNLDMPNRGYIISYNTDDVYSDGYRSYRTTGDWAGQDDLDFFFRIWKPVQKKVPLLQSSEVDRRYVFPLEMIALSQHEYTVFLGDDNNRFNSSILILTYDPPLGTNLSEYLSWIEGGGRLIVLNSLGHNAFANLMDLHSNDLVQSNGIEGTAFPITIPDIAVPHFSSGMKNIKTIAHFTDNGNPVSSFAFRKEIGNGELLYMEVLPYFSLLESGTDSLRRSLFAKLGTLVETLNLLPTNTSVKGNISLNYPYVVASGTINLTTNIQITTGSLLLSDMTELSLNSIDLSKANSFKINGKNSAEMIYHNLSIEEIEIIGSSFSIVNSSHVIIDSFRGSRIYGIYVPIQMISDFNWILDLKNNTYVTLKLSNDSKSAFEVEILGGTVELSLTPSTPVYTYMKNPLLSVQGEIEIDQAYVYSMPYHPIVTGDTIEISGNTSFIFDRSDTSYVFISDFDSDGKINVVSTPSAIDIKIPWKEVLSSPIHLFFLVNITFWLGWYVRGSIPKREKGRKDPT